MTLMVLTWSTGETSAYQGSVYKSRHSWTASSIEMRPSAADIQLTTLLYMYYCKDQNVQSRLYECTWTDNKSLMNQGDRQSTKIKAR